MVGRRVVDIYKKVQLLRKQDELTLHESARELGLDVNVMDDLEMGRRKIELNEVIRYCDYFGLDYEAFLFDQFVKFRKEYLADSQKMANTIMS